MTVPARRKHAPATSIEFEDDDAEESLFYAGERICAPSPNMRRARSVTMQPTG